MDNVAGYGFRFVKARQGDHQIVEEGIVAAAQSFDVNGGAQNVALRVGDPVIRLAGGGFNLCDGAEGAGGALAPYGIVVGIKQYWNGTRLVTGNSLPSDTAYGTNLERQTKILVTPVQTAYWEVDVDDIVTATTKAAYQAFQGENADHRLQGASGEAYASPRLDISGHNTTATLIWRIVEVSKTLENRDFAGAFVKLIVVSNVYQQPEVNATGV